MELQLQKWQSTIQTTFHLSEDLKYLLGIQAIYEAVGNNKAKKRGENLG